MTLRSKGGMKSETSAASTETIEERRVKRKTSEPCSEINELNEIKLNDITEHFRRQTDNASRRSNEQMKMIIMNACQQNTMEQMKSVVRQWNELMLQTVNAQFKRVHTTIKNMNVEGNSNFSEMTERSTAIEASQPYLKTPTAEHMRRNRISTNFTREKKTKRRHVKQQDSTKTQQNKKQQSYWQLQFWKQECPQREFKFKFPAKPITLQFTDVDERDKYIRSAYRQRSKARGRNIRFSQPWMRKRYQQKRLGYIKLSLREMHKIPLEKIILNRATKHVSIHGSDQHMRQRVSQVQQVPGRWAECRRAHGQMVDKKIVASTVSSRRTRPRSRIENRTTSGLDYTMLNNDREGDRRSGQGGGRRPLNFIDSDVPMCVQHSRKKYLTQRAAAKKKKKDRNEKVDDGGSKEAKNESDSKGANSSSMNGKKIIWSREWQRYHLCSDTKNCEVVEIKNRGISGRSRRVQKRCSSHMWNIQTRQSWDMGVKTRSYIHMSAGKIQEQTWCWNICEHELAKENQVD